MTDLLESLIERKHLNSSLGLPQFLLDIDIEASRATTPCCYGFCIIPCSNQSALTPRRFGLVKQKQTSSGEGPLAQQL